jgi:hypothetical protein
MIATTTSTSTTTTIIFFSSQSPQEFVAYCDKMKNDKEGAAISHAVEVQFERFRSPPPTSKPFLLQSLFSFIENLVLC